MIIHAILGLPTTEFLMEDTGVLFYLTFSRIADLRFSNKIYGGKYSTNSEPFGKLALFILKRGASAPSASPGYLLNRTTSVQQ